MYKSISKRENWGNQYFLNLWLSMEIYSCIDNLKSSQCLAKCFHCYTTHQNFTTIKFWIPLSSSYLVLPWSPSFTSCYSMSFKCPWIITSDLSLIRTYLGWFHGHNILFVIKWHFWVTVTHTSLLVLGECVKSIMLKYIYHC